MTQKKPSQELSTTLEQLENAIRDWENIMVEPETKKSPEIAGRTQGLLKRLREQIDELSS